MSDLAEAVESQSWVNQKTSLVCFGCTIMTGFVGALLLGLPRHETLVYQSLRDQHGTLTSSSSDTHRGLQQHMTPQPFAFDAGFGSNMVLQHGENTHAAIYGFLGPNCVGVKLDLFKATPDNPYEEKIFFTSVAKINATHQPFNDGPNDETWGPRPCSAKGCHTFNPWNAPLPKWKILLPPQQSPGGNFTIQATCIPPRPATAADEGTNTSSPTDDNQAILRMVNVTYGDVWYCSGQSNMELPLKFTFHRWEVAANLRAGKFSNIRITAGRSGNNPYYGADKKWSYAHYSNRWMTALDALHTYNDAKHEPYFLSFGATCWHFAQHLTELGVDHPIGLINTAIGGTRIQQWVDNRTLAQCHNRTRAGWGNQEKDVWWESSLFAQQVLPFVDMTIKGFLWYQGENNMLEVKGNSQHRVGYGCMMRALVQSWRKIWSETPGTTSRTAPFGIVTLAPDGDEGGPDTGAMRHAQTANFGVLPPPHHPVNGDDAQFLQGEDMDLANTFVAQAYDLSDEWRAQGGPCFQHKCCEVNGEHYDPKVCTNQTLYDLCHLEWGACEVSKRTPWFMGNIHPRSKREVGQRLAGAAFNLFFGGKEAYTGPTLQGCSVKKNPELQSSVLEIRFNSTLLRGDELAEPSYPPSIILPIWNRTGGGSQLYVQTQESLFCMEETVVYKGKVWQFRKPGTTYICPTWAGGTLEQSRQPRDVPYQDGWIEVPFQLKNKNTIVADLSVLPEGASPTAVKYAWGIIDCCDHNDPEVYVTKGCIANCPLKSLKGQLPANPFKAKIVDGHCECIAPQKCSDESNDPAGVN